MATGGSLDAGTLRGVLDGGAGGPPLLIRSPGAVTRSLAPPSSSRSRAVARASVIHGAVEVIAAGPTTRVAAGERHAAAAGALSTPRPRAPRPPPASPPPPPPPPLSPAPAPPPPPRRPRVTSTCAPRTRCAAAIATPRAPPSPTPWPASPTTRLRAGGLRVQAALGQSLPDSIGDGTELVREGNRVQASRRQDAHA
jgi:hypothetical protein